MHDDASTAAQLGRAIQRHRRARQWSQEALAERLEVSMGYVGLLERGERTPALPVVIAIAKIFETTVDALIAERSDDDWLATATELLAAVPHDARPAVLAMLRGVVAAGGSEPSE